jgi:murein DD-endopeptidase MepM/ murein hydrolase activator NlpD
MSAPRVLWLLVAAWLAGSGAWSENGVLDGSNPTSHLDDLYLNEAPVFSDGFESGNLKPWSSTIQPIMTVPPYADQSQMAGLWWPFCDSGSCPWSPPTQTHDGIDFTPNQDLAVFQAVAPGVVTYVDPYFNTGNGFWQVNVTVEYAHDNIHGLNYAFEPISASEADRDAQLANIDVVVGQVVAPGDVIGRLVQAHPNAHLHFGLFRNWNQVCPETVMSDEVRNELTDLIQRDNPGWNICN